MESMNGELPLHLLIYPMIIQNFLRRLFKFNGLVTAVCTTLILKMLMKILLRGFLGKMLFSGDEIMKEDQRFKRRRKSTLYG